MNTLDKLEEQIKSLISDYAALKKRNAEIEAAMLEKAQDTEETNRRFNELVNDREAACVKVDSLLKLLEDLNSTSINEVG